MTQKFKEAIEHVDRGIAAMQEASRGMIGTDDEAAQQALSQVAELKKRREEIGNIARRLDEGAEAAAAAAKRAADAAAKNVPAK